MQDKQLIRNLAVFLFLLSGSFVAISPLLFNFPGSGLDPAWKLGLNYAIAKNWQFGQDIVFTFGPYAPVYTGLYSPEFFSRAIFGRLLITLAIGLSIFLILQKQRFVTLKSVIWIAGMLMVCFVGLSDWLVVLPLLYYLFLVRMKGATVLSVVNIVVGVAALSLLSLIKGTYALASIGVLVLLLFSGLSRKIQISIWIGYLAGILALWGMAGQKFQNLIPFFSSWLSVMSGYSEAMSGILHSKNVAAIEIMGYLLICASICWLTYGMRKANIPTLLALALTLYIGFKAGFVRHDGHALIAGGILLLCSYLVLIQSQRKAAIYTVVASVIYYSILLNSYMDVSVIKQVREIASFVQASIQASVDYASTGTKKLDKNYQLALSEIQKSNHMAEVIGDVDIYSYRQDLLIANGMTWNPRPVFQSFAAYNNDLAEMNAKHLSAERAPQNILFQLETIDGRLPSLDDAKSWPYILSNYTADSMTGSFIHFIRKQAPSAFSTKLLQTFETHFGDEVQIPDSDQLIWAEVDIHPSLFGRLVNVLYKLPELRIAMKMAGDDHTSQDYRYIASLGRAGFLVSPYVDNTMDFSGLNMPSDSVHARKVASMQVYSKWRWAFSEKTTIRFYALKLPKQDQSTNPGGINSDFARLQRLRSLMAKIRSTHAGKIIDIGAGHLVLDAHATSSFKLTQNGTVTKLKLCYGIQDGAWSSGGQTDGVEFSLEYQPLNRENGYVLWKKYLDPLHKVKDRGEKCHQISLNKSKSQGVGNFYVTTKTGATDSWDWAYWSDVLMIP